MPAVVIAAVWKGTPFSTVMYLAALQGVPEELLDAAKIDGRALLVGCAMSFSPRFPR